MRLLHRSSCRPISHRASPRVVALVVTALLIVPVAGASGAWFTDAHAVSGSVAAATLEAVPPTVVGADAGNTVSWPSATEQPWATDAEVVDGVTYSVRRQAEGRPEQVVGTTSGTSFADPGGQPFAMVSAGDSHSLAVGADGSLWAWGSGADGRLGRDSTAGSASPVRVWSPEGVSFTQVSAGGDFSLALASDGSVWAWGDGARGRLGGTSLFGSLVPVRVAGTGPSGIVVVQVSAGSSHSLAVASDGSVWAWGAGGEGQLGRDSLSDSVIPEQVAGTGPGHLVFAQASAGDAFSSAVASDGSIWAWGYGSSGQLGNGYSTRASVPAHVTRTGPGAVLFTQVSAGGSHALGLATDGTVWAWGAGGQGRLGNAGNANSSVPVKVTATGPGAITVTQVSAGSTHSVGLASDGSVWAWGRGWNGRLGNSGTADSSTPVQVSGTGPGKVFVTQISGGRAHSLVTSSDGVMWAWGSGSFGQLGTGDDDSRMTPGIVGERKFTQVSAGESHSLAVDSSGQVWAWGAGSAGQLGDGGAADSNVPVLVSKEWSDGVVITQVSAAFEYSMALDSTGAVWTWGEGSRSRVPKRLSPGWGDGVVIVEVSAGDSQALVRDSAGKVWQWTARLSPSPTLVSATWGAGVNITQVSAGTFHSLAQDSAGRVWAWGQGASGQLGNGGTSDSSTPVLVEASWGDGVTIAQVSAGWLRSLAIDSVGRVWAWGAGSSGELGNGSFSSSALPVPVSATWGDGVEITRVSAGVAHSLALDSAGKVWSWGTGARGQLGAPLISESPVPVPASITWPAGVTITQLDAGSWNSFTIDSQGHAWAWGRGSRGELGNGVAGDQKTPLLVRSLPPAIIASNCIPPSTLTGQHCMLPGKTTYSVSYSYLGWSSPVATATITR